jgi:cell division protein FtsB
MIPELPCDTGRLRRWAARIALACALALALVFVPLRVIDPVSARDVRELERQLRELQRQQAALERDNARYRREISGLRDDPAALEDIARDDLGMVRPDDVVIRIEPGAASGGAAL